jgi:opacity protein-like surface antigen
MRKHLLAIIAAAMTAGPALAQESNGLVVRAAPYVGIEGGLMSVRDNRFVTMVSFDCTAFPLCGESTYPVPAGVDYKLGLDADLIGGFDLGLIRVEAELGYKRANFDEPSLDPDLVFDLTTTIQSGNTFDLRHVGSASVISAMLNGLVDIGPADGWAGYFGGGVGVAKARVFGDTDSEFAWQLIAGARVPISDNLDAGLKYRYFNTSKTNFDTEFVVGSPTEIPVRFGGKLRSHSILASVIYNFTTR